MNHLKDISTNVHSKGCPRECKWGSACTGANTLRNGVHFQGGAGLVVIQVTPQQSSAWVLNAVQLRGTNGTRWQEAIVWKRSAKGGGEGAANVCMSVKRERERVRKKSLSYKQQFSNSRKGFPPLSPFTGGGRRNEQEGSVSIAAEEVYGGHHHRWARGWVQARGGGGVSSWVTSLGSSRARKGFANRNRKPRSWKHRVSLSFFFCCSPRGGSSARTNGFVLHRLGTAGSVLSVVAVSERGCHQGAHAHGERGKSRRLRRRGLHVAHAVLARTVHVHGARAVRWEGLC